LNQPGRLEKVSLAYTRIDVLDPFSNLPDLNYLNLQGVINVQEATLGLLTGGAPPGLYHCVNRGAATWAEVGGYVADALGVSRAWLRPTEARGLRMRAQRPLYCALDNTRLEQALGRSMPTWQAAIDRYLSGG
jgi:dTDP-4-dehydrorhamnose reductase